MKNPLKKTTGKNSSAEEKKASKKPATHSTSAKQTDSNSNEQSNPLISPNTQLTMTLAWEEVEPSYKKILNRLAKKIKLDGFRPGAVPASIAKQHLNPEAIIEQTAQEVIQKAYPNFISQQSAQPIGRPEFKITKANEGEAWEIIVEIAEKPSIKLEKLDVVLKDLRKKLADEEKKWEKEEQEAEKDQAKKESDLDKKIDEEKIKAQKAERKKERALSYLYSQLVLHYQPAIPDLLVKQEAQEQIHSLGHQLERFKLTFADFLAQRQISQEQFIHEATTGALQRLQLTILVDALIQDRKLRPSEEEVEKALAKESPEAQEYLKKNPEAKSNYATRLSQQALEEYLLPKQA